MNANRPLFCPSAAVKASLTKPKPAIPLRPKRIKTATLYFQIRSSVTRWAGNWRPAASCLIKSLAEAETFCPPPSEAFSTVLCCSSLDKEGEGKKMPSICGTTAAAAAWTLISSAAEIIYGLADAFFFFSSTQQLLATTKATAINNSTVRAAENAPVWRLIPITVTAKVNGQKMLVSVHLRFS